MDRLGGVVFLENSNRVVTFHGEVLGERQRQVLQALCPSVSRRGFYLGGGTAVAQRGTRKDFVDIHALLRRHRPLPELLDLYRRKYDAEDVGHLLFGLSYFDDAEAEGMPTMLEDVAWEEVRESVADAVRDLVSG